MIGYRLLTGDTLTLILVLVVSVVVLFASVTAVMYWWFNNRWRW